MNCFWIHSSSITCVKKYQGILLLLAQEDMTPTSFRGEVVLGKNVAMKVGIKVLKTWLKSQSKYEIEL